MNRLLVLFALALFIPTVCLESVALYASAAATPQTLQTYKLYSDGASSTPSIHWDGFKFILTQNLEGTILIEDDGIVLDGAGFTLKGKGDSTGILLYDRSNVTIENIKVENFQTGILLGHYSPEAFLWYDPNPNRTTNCLVTKCTLSNNSIGIALSESIRCNFTGNSIINNIDGVKGYGSENVFRGNKMESSQYNLDLDFEYNEADSSNTVNGKPICYIDSGQNMTVPADAGMVVLKNCENILVYNLKLSYNKEAIVLINTSNSKIGGNTVTKNYQGIVLRNASNNLIIGNKLLNNSDDAIEQHYSTNITIRNNLIKANGAGIADVYGPTSKNTIIVDNQIIENNGHGIKGTTGCNITGNYIFGNKVGVHFSDITGSFVSKNNITGNSDLGIFCNSGTKALIADNSISKNQVGIKFGNPYSITIAKNDFSGNLEKAVQINGYAEDNLFFLNNFVGNNNNSIQASVKGVWVYSSDERYNKNDPTGRPQQVAGYMNNWDNGTVGNYWSDYSIRYPDAQAAEDPNISNTPYDIDDNNKDNHPLLEPLEFDPLEMPSTDVSPGMIYFQVDEEQAPLELFPSVLLVSLVVVVGFAVTGVVCYKKIVNKKGVVSL